MNVNKWNQYYISSMNESMKFEEDTNFPRNNCHGAVSVLLLVSSSQVKN
jgi:hypothetical protein